MAQVSVLYEHAAGTLWACWDDKRKEDICSVTDEEIVLIKDEKGEVFAFENLHFSVADPQDLKVKVDYDRVSKSLTVWFGDPSGYHARGEPIDEVLLIKNSAGEVIGIEKLNFVIDDPNDLQVSIQTCAEPF